MWLFLCAQQEGWGTSKEGMLPRLHSATGGRWGILTALESWRGEGPPTEGLIK